MDRLTRTLQDVIGQRDLAQRQVDEALASRDWKKHDFWKPRLRERRRFVQSLQWIMATTTTSCHDRTTRC